MKEPRFPGCTTGVSVYTMRNQYHMTGNSSALGAPPNEGKVVPQQECFTQSGKCTGFWPWYQGTQCVTGFSGEQQCCTAASTYPVIRECKNPDGSWRVVARVCPYCSW